MPRALHDLMYQSAVVVLASGMAMAVMIEVSLDHDVNGFGVALPFVGDNENAARLRNAVGVPKLAAIEKRIVRHNRVINNEGP